MSIHDIYSHLIRVNPGNLSADKGRSVAESLRALAQIKSFHPAAC